MTDEFGGVEPKRRVIVVDDERVVASTLAIILNRAGFEARAVFSGEEALELLESFTPDLLIADVIMPEMSGTDLAIVVHNKLPTYRILLFSGQAATSDMLKQTRSRGYEFEILAKPVHPLELLERLRD
jgi:DNA-binding response OmpR family regulator